MGPCEGLYCSPVFTINVLLTLPYFISKLVFLLGRKYMYSFFFFFFSVASHYLDAISLFIPTYFHEQILKIYF